MTPAPVEASVIIALYNGADHIEEQLLALAGQQTDVAWELILADNGCTDDTLAIIDRVRPRFTVPARVIDASARQGTSAARNQGAAVAAGGFLLFTDQDDVVDERWVHEIVTTLREHPFVGGRLEIVELNGETVASWRTSLTADGLPRLGDCRYAVGTNSGLTAAAFAAVGGFDESFSGGGEDVELARAMYGQGIVPVFAERAVVHYRYRADPWHAIRQMWGYGQAGARFHERFGTVPPTFVDVLIICQRAAKLALLQALQGRLPVRPAADAAYVLAEASALWSEPKFWRPHPTRVTVENPASVQLDRLRRLAGLVRHGTGGAGRLG